MVIILGYTLVRGLFRGIVKELSAIIGVLAGFYAAYHYYSEIACLLTQWMAEFPYLKLLSFFIIFCLVFFIVNILGLIIKFILDIAYLGWLDRLFGAVFGMMKGVLFVSILLILITTFLPRKPEIIKQSQLSPYVVRVAEIMISFSSEKMKKDFGGKITEVKEFWKHQK
jgi:membrane protein required for colicin V production